MTMNKLKSNTKNGEKVAFWMEFFVCVYGAKCFLSSRQMCLAKGGGKQIFQMIKKRLK